MDNNIQPSNIYITSPNNEKGEEDCSLNEQPNLKTTMWGRINYYRPCPYTHINSS